MSRALGITGVLLMPLLLSGCNLVEGLRQTSQRYETPTPFSDVWWLERKTIHRAKNK